MDGLYKKYYRFINFSLHNYFLNFFLTVFVKKKYVLKIINYKL